MWSAPCPGGAGDAPEFAYFHNSLHLPIGTNGGGDPDEIDAVLAFVTGESPLTIPPTAAVEKRSVPLRAALCCIERRFGQGYT